MEAGGTQEVKEVFPLHGSVRGVPRMREVSCSGWCLRMRASSVSVVRARKVVLRRQRQFLQWTCISATDCRKEADFSLERFESVASRVVPYPAEEPAVDPESSQSPKRERAAKSSSFPISQSEARRKTRLESR